MEPHLCFQRVTTICEEFDDETVMLDPRSGNFFVLDEVSRFIWDNISENTSLRMLADLLVDRYGIDKSEALIDVDEFLQELKASDLIRPAH